MNAGQFLDSLSAQGLLPAAEAAALRAGLTPKQLEADAEPLARDLVKQEKLTKYQAANVYKGRAKALVFGEYLVLDKIGAGGMGQVFKARHRRMKRIVALKILPPGSTKSESSVRRFYQEVEMAARLTHPNIVTAYDAGEAHGLHYLAMEFVDGKDLSGYLKKYGPLSVEQAMNCVLQAAQGLEYAHGLGIVHRDIKPSNLLVDRKATVKILDMGLARHESSAPDQPAEGDGLTMAGEVLGTLDFMAPEQAHDSRQADARADIYSLGCTLFRLLADQPPYAGNTPVQKLLAHREHPIPSLRTRRPEVPYRLDVLFQQMLAKDPQRRPRSMTEVIAALKSLLSGASEEESSISVLQEMPAATDDLGSFLSHAAEQSGPIRRGPGSSLNLVGIADSPISDLSPTARGEGSTRRQRRRPPSPAFSKMPKPILLGVGGAAALVVAGLAAWAIFGNRGSQPPAKKVTEAVERIEEPVRLAVPPPIPGVTAVVDEKPKPASPAPLATMPPKSVPKAEPAKAASKPVPLAKATTAAARPAMPAQPAATSTGTAPKPQMVTESVDLLTLLDLKRDVVEDRWTLEGGILTRYGQKDNARLLVPFAPASAYDLTIILERKGGDHALTVGLYIDGRQIALNVTLNDCGLEPQQATVLARRPLPPIGSSKVATLVCSVRGGRIYTTIDGVPAIDWSGNPQDLHSNWSIPNKQQMYLAVTGAAEVWRISKFEIAPPTRVLPNYQRIDLLASMDLAKSKVAGDSEFVKGDLLLRPTAETGGTRVAVVIPRPNEYVLTAVVERIAGQESLGIGLPFSGGRVGSTIDFGSPEETGLSGWGASTRLSGDVLALPPWQPHTVVYTLHRDRLALSIDGRTYSETTQVKLEPARKRDELTFSLPFAFTIFGGPLSNFRISRLELTPRAWKPLPLPSTPALVSALKSCEPQIAQARGLGTKPEQKAAGAQQLWRQAVEKPEQLAERYVLIEAAGRLAAEAGDLALTSKLAIEMDRTFLGDHQAFYDALLPAMFKTARTAAAKQLLAGEAIRQIEAARVIEDFDLALALQSACMALKPLPPDMVKELKARGIELAFWREEHDAWEKGLDELASKSDAPSAQAAVARYLALVRGDWTEAMKYLSQSGDAALLAAVKAEITGPRTASDQVAAGEHWWALADKATGPLKWAYMERAAVWYRRAAATTAGKSRTTIDQRMRVLSQQRKPSGFAFTARHPLDATRVGDHWYKQYRGSMRWQMARSICESVGGTLPILKTAADNQGLMQFLSATAKSEDKIECWLGATDEEQEGTFRWLDGTPLADPYFVNWRKGEPNSQGGNEDYLLFEYVPTDLSPEKTGWSDYGATGSHPFVCQWDF